MPLLVYEYLHVFPKSPFDIEFLYKFNVLIISFSTFEIYIADE